MVLTEDYLYSFRNNCSVWRREKCYLFHIHFNSVINFFLVALLFYRSRVKDIPIPFSFTGIMGFDMLNYPGVTIICTYLMKYVDDGNNFLFANFEDYSSRGEKIHQKIQKIAGYMRPLAYGGDVCVLLIGATVINSEYRCNKYLYIFRLLDSFDIGPILYRTLVILYFLHFLNNCRIALSGMNLFPYFVFHYILQYILLKERARSLRRFEKNDGSYQNDIKENLERIIRHSQTLTAYHNFVSTTLRLPLFFLMIILAFFSVFIYLMSLFAENIPEFIVIFGDCCLHFTALALLAAMGQYYTNQTEELWYELLECPWYEWNMKNKRLYHTLLTFHVKRENKIYTGIISLTHETIILLGRRIAAAITFVGTVGSVYFT